MTRNVNELRAVNRVVWMDLNLTSVDTHAGIATDLITDAAVEASHG